MSAAPSAGSLDVNTTAVLDRTTVMNAPMQNLDPDVAAGFGHEWSTFSQGEAGSFAAMTCT
jgi:hypothetical protein